MTARPRDEDLPAQLRELAAPLAEQLGVDLVDVEVKGQPGRRVVKLVADSLDPAEGLGVDTIASLSRAVGDALDGDEDLVPGAFTLEVTSPGATRPLRRGRDFQRNLGREVVVHAKPGVSPGEVTGEVVAADDDAVTLRVAGGDEQRLALADVDHGKVVLPW